MWGADDDPNLAGGGTLDATAKGMLVLTRSAAAAAVAAALETAGAAGAVEIGGGSCEGKMAGEVEAWGRTDSKADLGAAAVTL